MNKITVNTVCQACSGTGVYQGMAEKDGAFVECYKCKGTGCATITYEPFEHRKIQPKCKRVYKQSHGYCITDHDVEVEGKRFPFSQYGCTYQEWLNGEKPKEMRFLGCPMLIDQGACHQKKGFIDRCNTLNGGWLSHIPSCKNTENKDECWRIFDKTIDLK